MVSKWVCRNKSLSLAAAPLIMGILNVTPDSFSDGGRCPTRETAVARAGELLTEGADILDVGGESTRPGAEGVGVDAELQRVIPVIEGILARHADAVVSVDTMKAEVARAAMEAGACIINDVSAMTHDADMISVASASRAGVVLMHMRGSPRTMQMAPQYADVVAEVSDFLESRCAALIAAGVAPAAIAIDPGIGFGKTLEHNLSLLRAGHALNPAGHPLVMGLSRKSFLGKITGQPVEARLAASLAGACYSILKGANVLRVHDVAETHDAIRVWTALSQEGAA